MNGLRPAVEGTQVLPPSVKRRIELVLNAARLVQPEKGILAAGPKMPLLALPHHLPTRSFGPLPTEDAGRQILDSLRGHSQSVGQLNQGLAGRPSAWLCPRGRVDGRPPLVDLHWQQMGRIGRQLRAPPW